MITPSNYYPDMTKAEAIAGYLADGWTREDAEVYAAVLTRPLRDGVGID